MAGISTSGTARKPSGSPPPVLWRADGRPDPSLLTPQQRLAEFGSIMFRAIERRKASKVNPEATKAATSSQ